jgi:hypothetical protein
LGAARPIHTEEAWDYQHRIFAEEEIQTRDVQARGAPIKRATHDREGYLVRIYDAGGYSRSLKENPKASRGRALARCKKLGTRVGVRVRGQRPGFAQEFIGRKSHSRDDRNDPVPASIPAIDLVDDVRQLCVGGKYRAAKFENDNLFLHHGS